MSKDKLKIRTALKRMVKVLRLYHNLFLKGRKAKDIVKTYAESEGLNINGIGKYKYLAFVLEQYNNPESKIYKRKTLPVIPLTQRQYDRKYNKRPKTKSKVEREKSRRQIYKEYLLSYKWIKFRNKIKLQRGNRCEICGISKTGLHGHHLTYERFMNELPEDIQILCKSCHDKVHKKINKKNNGNSKNI